MNLAILLAALLPWAATPTAAFTRLFLAISVLSVEMQLVTLLGVGTLYTLPFANVILAVLLIGWQIRSGPPFAPRPWLPVFRPPVPWPAVALLGALVLGLNTMLPLATADPYHLERVAQIERLGTLAYDPAAEFKVNILGWIYELILADARQIPVIGAGLVQMHGVFGLLLYSVTIATVSAILPLGFSQWPMLALLLVPSVFHQLVLIKNDLFVAAPALVALAWLVARARSASWIESIWAGWLVGFVVGYKLTNLPLVLVMGVGIVARQRGRAWRPLGGLALGGCLGVVASGLLLTSVENTRWYGDAFASGLVEDMGNRTTSPGEAVESVARFGLSLVDLGYLTPRLWPGRGGWGGTFGLPFIWAAAVLILLCRHSWEARWALTIAAFQFVAFSAVFLDADVAHRLALAPALLVIAVAVHLLDRPDTIVTPARWALVPVLALSSAQMLRSAFLYLTRA